jgi:hypothetical protein
MDPRYLLPAFILLSGCQSTPNNAALPSDSTSSATQELKPIDHLQKATLDIAIARESGIIWLVTDGSTGRSPVSLEKLLQQAVKEHDAGNILEFHRLALKVSTIVALALEQDRLNSTAGPQTTLQSN